MQNIFFNNKILKASSIRHSHFPLRLIYFIPLSLSVLTVSAQNAEEVYVEISQCLPLQTSSQRLACFETAAELVIGTQDDLPSISSEIVNQSLPNSSFENDRPEPDTENVVSTSNDDITNDLDDFGINTQAARIIENETSGNEELIDHITALREREPGKYLITLASGQVWYQMYSKRFRLRKDMEVKIYLSPFGGSYRLSTPSLTGYIQVKRVE